MKQEKVELTKSDRIHEVLLTEREIDTLNIL
jgi:hypothetical protein